MFVIKKYFNKQWVALEENFLENARILHKRIDELENILDVGRIQSYPKNITLSKRLDAIENSLAAPRDVFQQKYITPSGNEFWKPVQGSEEAV